jgi:hypothetical protein
MRRLGAHLVNTVLWCWTADAIVDGEYRRDGVKYDLDALPHTAAAARAADKSDLRHEHAVPRKAVVHHLVGMYEAIAKGESEHLTRIESVLAVCPPVIVTVSEAETLDVVHRSQMPLGWTFGESPLARYKAAKIVASEDEILFPPRGFWRKGGRYAGSE